MCRSSLSGRVVLPKMLEKHKLLGKSAGKDDLVVIHNMGASCAYCTLWGDGFNGVYEHLANKFFEHFLYIADAMNSQSDDDDGAIGLWDSQDEFYYDQLYLPTGERIPLKVRSGVGVIPIYAVETLDQLVATIASRRR